VLTLRPTHIVAIEKRPKSPDAPVILARVASILSDAPTRSFGLAFAGLLCATVIGLASEIRPLKPDSPDYGYDEALGAETSSLSGASFLSCSVDGPATAGASVGGFDRRGARAIGAQASASPTSQLRVEGIGGDRAG
jgi:hypothetical protein